MPTTSQDAEELFVRRRLRRRGPTLEAFRPRARAGRRRIRKRSSHITVIVARMSDERLEVVQAVRRLGTGRRRPGLSA